VKNKLDHKNKMSAQLSTFFVCKNENRNYNDTRKKNDKKIRKIQSAKRRRCPTGITFFLFIQFLGFYNMKTKGLKNGTRIKKADPSEFFAE